MSFRISPFPSCLFLFNNFDFADFHVTRPSHWSFMKTVQFLLVFLLSSFVQGVTGVHAVFPSINTSKFLLTITVSPGSNEDLHILKKHVTAGQSLSQQSDSKLRDGPCICMTCLRHKTCDEQSDDCAGLLYPPTSLHKRQLLMV